MGKGRDWEVGDRVYRFGFDPKKPTGYLDVFELTEISKGRKNAKYRSVKTADATIGNGCYVSLSLINTVYSSGSGRFVLLDEDNYWRARRMLAEHLANRRKQLEHSIAKLNAFENWLNGQTEDDLH